MFVVRNGLKNMIHQLLDAGEHMVGFRFLTYMDVMRSTITEYAVRMDEYLVKSWANDGVSA